MNISNIDTKQCIKCNNIKTINLFSKGRRSCRLCCNIETKIYKQQHKENISTYNKKYKEVHKDKIKEYNQNYNIENRLTIQTRHTLYLKNKRKTDPKYKMSCLLRNRIKAFLNGENRKKTKMLLGCDYNFIKNWLESQFSNEMNFKNHGIVWHIDHVIPCNKFNILDEIEQLQCFNWSNLQPLLASKNLRKKDKINIDEIIHHENKVNNYVNINNIQINKYIFNQYNKNKFCN